MENQVTFIEMSRDPISAAKELQSAVGLTCVFGGRVHIQPFVNGPAALTMTVNNGQDLVLLVKSLQVILLQLTESGFI